MIARIIETELYADHHVMPFRIDVLFIHLPNSSFDFIGSFFKIAEEPAYWSLIRLYDAFSQEDYL